jgi:hypothetical protein
LCCVVLPGKFSFTFIAAEACSEAGTGQII